ncbi:MAG TPA: ion transporter [Micromonosporaceae bacterium]|nr:ion transporter [Micromonosporaceae bacterium]
MSKRAEIAELVESRRFHAAIIAVIVFNAFTLGLETFDPLVERAGGLLYALDRIVIAIFVAELTLRIYAHGWRFFRDPWNVFDFLVVGAALIPASSGLSILRALRIVRALRLVSAVPGMRRVVDGLLRAIPAMVSIILLLGLVLYVGGVLATEMYGPTAPQHFGNLGRSLFTLFQVMTGEAWPDVAADVLAYHPYAWIFFVIYILVSTFVVLNLFTAVVVSAMEPERQEEIKLDETVLAELRALRAEVQALRVEREAADGDDASGAGSGATAPAQRTP